MTNLLLDSADKPSFSLGLDGLPYAHWKDNLCSWEYAEAIFGPNFTGKIACFGGYENAVLLQDTIGM